MHSFHGRRTYGIKFPGGKWKNFVRANEPSILSLVQWNDKSTSARKTPHRQSPHFQNPGSAQSKGLAITAHGAGGNKKTGPKLFWYGLMTDPITTVLAHMLLFALQQLLNPQNAFQQSRFTIPPSRSSRNQLFVGMHESAPQRSPGRTPKHAHNVPALYHTQWVTALVKH